jgi:hydrogenase-4 component F
MQVILLLLLSIPALASGVISLARNRRAMELIHAFASVGALIVGGVVAAGIWTGQPVVSLSLLRADALSAFMIAIVTFVGAIAALYSVGYIRLEFDAGQLKQVRLFYVLFQLFVFTMLLAVTTDNLGVMWVAIEGTTLATVFLVNLHDNPKGLEAAYKYLIISSVGIAFAFMGTVLVYYAAFTMVGEIGLSWTMLMDIAARLNPGIVRLAFIFILIGYGTKAGLAPMHTWLPDAHSEAPAPISALMSGVLLNVGLYALMRFKAVADVAAPGFASTWLMRFGLLSLGLAAAFLLSQRNYKRMLAYSSVEHTGIVALGLGFGGYWGLLGALLHMMNHALSKSMLFLLSGNISLKYHTTDIRRVRGLLTVAPWTGFAFLSGTLALVGLPPFGPFISEFIIFRAGFAGHSVAYVVMGVALLALVFAGMLASLNHMLYGPPSEQIEPGDPLRWALMPIALNMSLLVGFGLTLPNGVREFFGQALKVLGVPL